MSESHSNLITSEPPNGNKPAVELSALPISLDHISQIQLSPDAFGVSEAFVRQEKEIANYQAAVQNQTVQALLNFQSQQELVKHREMMVYQTQMTQMAIDVTGLMLKELEASRQFQKDMQIEMQKSRIAESEANKQFQKDLMEMFISKQAAPTTPNIPSFGSLQHFSASSNSPINLLTNARPHTLPPAAPTIDGQYGDTLNRRSTLRSQHGEKTKSSRMSTKGHTASNAEKNGASATGRKRKHDKVSGDSSEYMCQECNVPVKTRFRLAHYKTHHK